MLGAKSAANMPPMTPPQRCAEIEVGEPGRGGPQGIDGTMGDQGVHEEQAERHAEIKQKRRLSDEHRGESEGRTRCLHATEQQARPSALRA